MKRLLYSIFIVLFFSIQPIFSASNDSLIQAQQDILKSMFLDGMERERVGDMSWENPSLLPWKLPESDCSAKGGYSSYRESTPMVSGKGDGIRDWEIGADAYILTPNGCVSGRAGYVNGMILSPIWNESGEYDRIYPYLIADSIGGKLHTEKYYFEGGYSHKGGNIAWGVEGSYTAVLSYRDVDPRPRNVSGDLTVKGGFSYRVWRDYYAGVSARYNRYRISTEISFVNETGETKLFHLTGLGTHYSRFDGTGKSVFNDCHTGGFSLNLIPSGGKGGFLNADFSFMSMRHVITDLNRLPMANLNEKNVHLQLGFKKTSYAIWGEWKASRRHGKENIFGDASSGSYPQIGSLTLYADNFRGGTVAGYWGFSTRRMNMSILPRAEWNRERIVYLSPRRDWLDEHIALSADFRMNILSGSKSFTVIRCGVGAKLPVSSLLSLPDPGSGEEDKALHAVTTNDFANATSGLAGGGLGGEWLWRFSGRLAAGVTADYSYSHTSTGISINRFSIGLTAHFR